MDLVTQIHHVHVPGRLTTKNLIGKLNVFVIYLSVVIKHGTKGPKMWLFMRHYNAFLSDVSGES